LALEYQLLLRCCLFDGRHHLLSCRYRHKLTWCGDWNGMLHRRLLLGDRS